MPIRRPLRQIAEVWALSKGRPRDTPEDRHKVKRHLGAQRVRTETTSCARQARRKKRGTSFMMWIRDGRGKQFCCYSMDYTGSPGSGDKGAPCVLCWMNDSEAEVRNWRDSASVWFGGVCVLLTDVSLSDLKLSRVMLPDGTINHPILPSFDFQKSKRIVVALRRDDDFRQRERLPKFRFLSSNASSWLRVWSGQLSEDNLRWRCW